MALSRERFRQQEGRLEETRLIFAIFVQKHLQENVRNLLEGKYTYLALNLSNPEIAKSNRIGQEIRWSVAVEIRGGPVSAGPPSA